MDREEIEKCESGLRKKGYENEEVKRMCADPERSEEDKDTDFWTQE